MISTFELPTKILFGVGSMSQLGEEAQQLGEKALVVTYPDIRRIGLLDRVIDDLKANGVDTSTFEKVEPNPRSSTVDEGASIVRKEKVDLTVHILNFNVCGVVDTHDTCEQFDAAVLLLKRDTIVIFQAFKLFSSELEGFAPEERSPL